MKKEEIIIERFTPFDTCREIEIKFPKYLLQYLEETGNKVINFDQFEYYQFSDTVFKKDGDKWFIADKAKLHDHLKKVFHLDKEDIEEM